MKKQIIKYTHQAFLQLIIAACLFFTTSCGLIISRFTPTRQNTNTTVANSANSNSTISTNSNTSFDSGKYKKLLDKRDEFVKLSPPLKLDPKAAIKGKVFFITENLGSDNNLNDVFSDVREAKSLDELETIVRLVCKKGRFIGSYENMSADSYKRSIKAYGVECEAALIDYRQNAIVAQKKFSNNKREEVISDKYFSGDEYQNPPPMGEIARYIHDFPIDKALPEMTALYAKELIKLLVSVNLKPDAAIRDKIKIVRKIEEGAMDGSYFVKIDDYENFGFPFNKIALAPKELETLVKIICRQGSPIGKNGKTTQYSSKCEVSIIDYKTSSVIAQKNFENKTPDEDVSEYHDVWVVKMPKQEIEDYLKSIPAG